MEATDPVVLSFVFVGCNRVGFSEKDHLPLPASTANEPQLRQTVIDVANLARQPEYVFLVGDIVRNEVDGQTLTKQLTAWQQLWSNEASANGLTAQLVPITGNHEVLRSVEYDQDSDEAHESSKAKYYEVPDPSANAAWLAWLTANGHPPKTGNGPTQASSPKDLLIGDNSRLTWSFEHSTGSFDVHFQIVDTDTDSTFAPSDTSCYQATPAHGQHVPGWVAANWIAKDIAAAGPSDLVFALGHKPLAFSSHHPDPSIETSTGRDSVFNCDTHRLADQLHTTWSGSSQFVAYLTAHRHRWEYGKVEGDVQQIIAGDGGSELDYGVHQKAFGFTVVEVLQSGAVRAIPYTRSVPDPYYSDKGVGPATAGSPIELR